MMTTIMLKTEEIGPLCDWLNVHGISKLEELEELLRRAKIAKGFWDGSGLTVFPPDPIEVLEEQHAVEVAKLHVQEGVIELV